MPKLTPQEQTLLRDCLGQYYTLRTRQYRRAMSIETKHQLKVDIKEIARKLDIELSL